LILTVFIAGFALWRFSPYSRRHIAPYTEISNPPKSPSISTSGLRGSLEEIVSKAKPAIVFIRSQQSLPDFLGYVGEGTGFIIGANGYILTCLHVVESSQGLRVRFNDGHHKDAEVVWQNKANDLALLKVEEAGLPSIFLERARQFSEGHPVLAIGYPLGSSLGVELTVTEGILSSIRRDMNGEERLQISAPVNPGNSGGPLLSAQNGNAIGIVNAKIILAEGLGFAVPITSDLRKSLMEVMQR
jgi:S1-C subfamily serine protease